MVSLLWLADTAAATGLVDPRGSIGSTATAVPTKLDASAPSGAGHRHHVPSRLISALPAQGNDVEPLNKPQIRHPNAEQDPATASARDLADTRLNWPRRVDVVFGTVEVPPRNSIPHILQQAQLALSRWDIGLARPEFDRARQIDPDAVDVKLLEAEILRRQDRAEAAKSTMNSMIAQQPGDVSARLDRASRYIALDRDTDAAAEFRAAPLLHPTQPKPIFREALLFARAQAFAKADIPVVRLLAVWSFATRLAPRCSPLLARDARANSVFCNQKMCTGRI